MQENALHLKMIDSILNYDDPDADVDFTELVTYHRTYKNSKNALA